MNYFLILLGLWAQPILAHSQIKFNFTLYASPNGGKFFYQDKEIDTLKLEDALLSIKPGNRLLLLPGEYKNNYSLNLIATEKEPILIEGIPGNSHIVGTAPPTISGPPCFLIENSEWIVFQNLQVRECWPHAFKIKNSRFLTFRNLNVVGSRRVIEALGQDSHHLLIENNQWVQDSTGAIWRDLPWAEMHHGQYQYFNGAFFASQDIGGDVIFRNNYLDTAFNALRSKDSYQDQESGRNLNFEIYGNVFRHIRDNPIEPEGHAHNWFIHHNHIDGAHAWFSFDGVRSHGIYIFSNTAHSLEKYGIPGDHSSGKIFKFLLGDEKNEGEIYLFHNSFITRQNLIGGGATHSLRAWNNIFAITKEGSIIDWRNWQSNYQFDHNLYVHKNFHRDLQAIGQEENGIAADPKFRSDFSVSIFSPARNSGKVFELLGWNNQTNDSKPNIGAFENGKRVKGPAFRAVNAPYGSRLRIVDVRFENSKLHIYFSRPLLTQPELILNFNSGDNYFSRRCEFDNYKISCPNFSENRWSRVEKVFLPSDLRGAEGEVVTLWGSISEKFSLIPPVH